MKTIITFGITEGYNHNNEQHTSIETVCEALKVLSGKVMNETNVYVSGVVKEASVYYKTEWGCPEGGEKVFELSATHNPAFVEKAEWKEAVVKLAKEIKKEFKQSTLTIDFIESEMIYLD